MNIRISNQLNMVGACLNVANSNNYKPVWTGNPPLDFAADLALLQTDYDAIKAKAALADGATGGASDAKATAESALEDAAYVLARALVNHFKKTSNLDNLGQVDVSKSELVQLRNQDLVSRTTEIRDLANAAQAQPGAAGRGVTAARVAALTAAITDFSAVMSSPRGHIVNRSTLLKEVETDTAGLLEQAAALDDLALQFDSTETGRRFIEAWKRARIILDATGTHPGKPADVKPTPAPPGAPK